MWNSPELIHYSDNKEEVAYESGKIIGGMLLVAATFKSAKDVINALKSDIHVQYMVTSAKLQMQGIISKSETLAALGGKISNILKCVEGSFNAEAMAYLEEYLTAEKGSRFLEVVRKLEKELGSKKTQLDTAKAKRIVECLDDGMSVDDVVAELKTWCESGGNFEGQIYKGTRNLEKDFINDKGKSTLIKHADKHGYASAEEYLGDARNFLEKQPTSTTQSFVSEEGTYFRYDTATNEFGIINKYGGISTYFKPDEGIVYWLEQIEKYGPK